MTYVAEAEAVANAEGNMCGAAMRGTVALPGSETTSRKKGTRRNLGDLVSPAAAMAVPGRDGKSRRRSRRGKVGGVGRLHSTDEASNKADRRAVAERVEGRRPVGGRASCNACPGHSAGSGMSPRREPTDRNWMGRPSPERRSRLDLRQEPGAGKPHAGICAGGGR